jgi:glycosyltransferase involved in cell wall biosynthesis
METARAFRGSKPLVVAPLGVDTALFSSAGERAALEGDPCLLQVGSLTPVKNHRLSIASFAKIATAHPGAHLHLVGNGPLKRELAARSRAFNLGERIHFHETVPHHELPAINRAADLHLVSSFFESQCMAVVEAAACGTATIGTAVGILPDFNTAAITSDGDDPGALAGRLLEVLEHRPRIRELGVAAHDLVCRELDLEACTTRLLAVYSGGTESRSR